MIFAVVLLLCLVLLVAIDSDEPGNTRAEND